jgi:inner membrane protease subunit 1
MQPAIYDRDVVVVEKISLMLGNHGRGNIVLAKSLHTNDPRLLICKRITAIAHDFIPSKNVDQDTECVPRGHVWVEGDNKSESLDSREYGPLPIGLIQGTVIFRVWPLSRMGFIRQTQQITSV